MKRDQAESAEVNKHSEEQDAASLLLLLLTAADIKIHNSSNTEYE